MSKMTKFYRFAKAVCNGALTLWFRIEVHGVENLLAEGGYIVVANHRTYLDPVLVGIRMKRQVNFMAKAELFSNKLLGPIIKRLGAFPVSRGTGDSSAIEKAVDTVKHGDVLALFPEGTRSKTGEIMRFKSGAIVVAAQTGADIVPTAIYFENCAKFRSRVVIRYGAPIPNGALQVDIKKPRTIKAASNLVRDAVCALWEESGSKNS